MLSASRALPIVVHLPSGAVVRVKKARAVAADVALVEGESLEGQLAALSGQLVNVERERGGLVDLRTLPLEDFHVLRTVVLALGLLPEEPVKRLCVNCDEPLTVALSRSVPLGPFLDGELDDEELDEPFAFDEAHVVGAPGPDAARVTLSRLSVDEAHELWAVASSHDRRRMARRLGVLRFDDVTDPRRIVRKIDKLDDDHWEALLDLFEAAHYPPRLTALVRCPSCDAESSFRAPRVREFPELGDATEPLPEPADMAGFPSPDAFFAAMHDHGKTIAERLAIARVDEVPLLLEEGVPHVDDGGAPLLGSYTPPIEGEAGLGPQLGEVRLYYRTFRNLWLEEGPYDVDAEIAETIEHELEHHLAFLRGYDETDEEERAQIVRDRQRVQGRKETRREARGRSFLGRTWPLWAILALLVLVAYLERS
jgi:hypothetical protein